CFASRRRHTRSKRDWSSDVCSSDLDLRDYRGCKQRCWYVQQVCWLCRRGGGLGDRVRLEYGGYSCERYPGCYLECFKHLGRRLVRDEQHGLDARGSDHLVCRFVAWSDYGRARRPG